MPLISIIVPVYNVEKYLERCIDSVLKQTLVDFELILVNDGSADRSGLICDFYAKKDCRIKVIHKENRGLSDARNTGLEAAEGQYIGFVDSDDYISEDMYNVLYNNILMHNADISVCEFYNCDENGKCFSDFNDGMTEIKEFPESINMLLERFLVSSCIKLYNKKTFEKIRYPIGKISEDIFIIMDIFLKGKRVVFDRRKLYYYVHRRDSITTNLEFSSREYDPIYAWKRNLRLMKKYCPKILFKGYYWYWTTYRLLFNKCATMKFLKKEEKDKTVGFISGKVKKNLLYIVKNKKMSLKEKVSFVLIALLPFLYLNFQRMRFKKKIKILII